MKKIISLNLCFILLCLCGCTQGAENMTETRFLFDTVVTLTARCNKETMEGAFRLCEEYERRFSATHKKSEIYKLNNTHNERTLSNDTAKLLKKALAYCEKTGGEYDITIYPVSKLWNFKKEIVPEKNEIAEALKSVDYQTIQFDGERASLNGAQIDLGSIAKGYIAEKLVEYFTKNGVKKGIINLGGNIRVFGNKKYKVGILKPYSKDENAAVVEVKNMSVVTSGIYQRCFEKQGLFYHHILDTATGFPKNTDLLSATVIGEDSTDCDALSTICILFGKEKAIELIENSTGCEAVLIDKDYNLYYTSGLTKEKEVLKLL